MKKIFQINVTKNGSTGSIMRQIHGLASKKYISKFYYGRGPQKNIFNKFEIYFSVFLSRIFSKNNEGCYYNTYSLINEIKKFKPDLIQLHNVHGYYLNLPIFFKYLKKLDIPIVWTLHDCSSYTGHCAYYTRVGCDKWKSQCFNCPQKREYPKNLIFDTSKSEYKKKVKMFKGIKNLSLVVPSNWLKNEVEKSFLNDYKVQVIHNAIDLSVFKPIVDKNIRKRYNLGSNKIILGVANIWDERKGLDYFLKLSKIIDKNVRIVLVGLTKKQINSLPENIIGIERTNSVEELVKLYTVADVFLNPSLEETFSLVTLEALACGTPCLVFNSTATPELITEKVGIVIDNYDIKNIYKNIKILFKKECSDECVKRAKQYDLKNYKKYIDLYDKLMEE